MGIISGYKLINAGINQRKRENQSILTLRRINIAVDKSVAVDS